MHAVDCWSYKECLYKTVVVISSGLGTAIGSNFAWKYVQGSNFCPNDLSYIKDLRSVFEIATCGISSIRDVIRSHTAQYVYPWTIQGLFVSASLEEVVCRGLIQRGLLYHLPKVLIVQISPDAVKYLDCPSAKVVRVVFASGVFALLHVANWDCSHGGTLPQFIGGMVFGVLCENEGFLSSCIAHTVHNCAIQFLSIQQVGRPIIF